MELDELKYLLKNESAFWSNNKRRIHGLPLRRKQRQTITQFYIKAKDCNIISDIIMTMPSLTDTIYYMIEKDRQYDKRKI